MMTGIDMHKKGEKVLVRMMECTNKQFDQWDVIYRDGVIDQEAILKTSDASLYTVILGDGTCTHAWSFHILPVPNR